MREIQRSWVQEEVEVVGEEEDTLLQVRKSRIDKNDSKRIEISTVGVGVNNENYESNGHAIQSTGIENEVNKEESTFGNEQKVEEFFEIFENEREYAEGKKKSENLVSYDKVEGVGITSSYSGEGQNEKHPGKRNLEVLSQKFVVQNSSNSHASLQTSKVPFQGGSVRSQSSKEIESADSDLANVNELEETELDVERVLQKQTTHDLYCPNCNSCITRRVILRKRKRIIQIPDEEFKRSKTEPTTISKPGIGTVQASEDEKAHLLHANNNGLEDADHFTGPDLFRCLSCFSFFIPIGNGFKLFRIFGDKSRKENVGDEQVPRTKKNWFASMFASNYLEKTTVEQGDSFQAYDGKRVVRVVTLPKLGDENGQISSVTTHASEELVVAAENKDTLKFEDKILLSPRHELSLNGILIHGAEHGPEKTTEEIDRVHSPIFSQQIITKTKFDVQSGESLKVDSILSVKGVSVMQGTGKDTVITIDTWPTYEIEQDTLLPEGTVSELPTISQIGIAVDHERTEVIRDSKIEVIKSIVYGGLAESITSLSVVSSAAGGDAATLNILALGMANLIGGFFVISHNLWELRNDCIERASDRVPNQETDKKDRYKELLGRRENFILHAVVLHTVIPHIWINAYFGLRFLIPKE